MLGPPRFTRAGVLVGLPLLAGLLFSLPSTTDESTVPSAPATPPAVVRTAEVPTAVLAGPLRVPAEARRADPVLAAGRPGSAGMLIGIDPETGQLGMPTPEQLKNLSDLQQYQVDHSDAGLVEVHHPDGSVSIDLQGRFQEYATVRIGPDGKLIFQCVDGAESAERALQSPASGSIEGAPVVEPAAPARPASEER
jgi:hypothetical protein